MTLQQLIVIGSLALLVMLLVRGKHEPSFVFAGVAFLYLLVGLIDVKQALAQFTNEGLVTVVALLLVSVVLDKSHLIDLAVQRLLCGGYRWTLLKLTLTTGAYSAFLNNTAVVASLIGPLRESRHHSASRLLLPMCYAASIGGVLTLVGTSTNLLVSSFLIGRGLPPLQMFDLLPVGALILVSTSLVMVFTFPHLLKDSPRQADVPAVYFLEAKVLPRSALIGRSVQDSGLRNLGHLFLSEVVRDGRLIAPVEPDEVIVEGDVLVFAGDVTRLDLLSRFGGLQMYSQAEGLPLDNLVEVIVAPNAPIARQTVRDVNFRSRFDAAVVAVRRGEHQLKGSIGSTLLMVGDQLVLAVGKDFDKRNNLVRNFIVVSRPSVSKFVDPVKSFIAVGAFMAVVCLSAVGVINLLKGLLALLVLALAAGYVKTSELRRNLPLDLTLIIGSALVISDVMLSTGSAHLLSTGLLSLFEPWGAVGALVGILLLTWVLTELMTNNAAVALSFPIALAVADKLQVQPAPFVMAALYGASASFLTPYGYQTNLMVMAPGKYSLVDYLRAGSPVALAYLATALVAIPVFFPFAR
jgi:di/tricarboxylate transporter